MNITQMVPLSLLCLLSLASCDRAPAPSSAKSAAAGDPIMQDVKEAEYEVRLTAANKRIEELERKVGALEATPEALDLDLLTQRVQALEVKAMAGAPISTGPLAEPTRAAELVPRDGREARRAPTVMPRLKLPDLERRSRVASPSEAQNFSRKPEG